MHLIDWLMLILPSLAVVYIAWRTHNYTKGVAGFLAGGRVAGRYVVAVSSGEADSARKICPLFVIAQ